MNGTLESTGRYEKIAPDVVAEAQGWGLWLSPRVIAIDGPAGSGKSTVGYVVAEILDFLYFDTGAMYRAVTWAAWVRSVKLEDGDIVGQLAEELDMQILPPRDVNRHGRNSVVLVDGQEVTAEIRRPEVDQRVSVVSAHSRVRTALSKRQRDLGDRYGVGDGEKPGIVMVGRDIGTVIMPGAALKIYLDASVAERARRRHRELLSQGKDIDYRQVAEAIVARDRFDSQRDVSPLRAAEDAVVVDTSNMGIDQVVETILKLVIKVGQGGGTMPRNHSHQAGQQNGQSAAQAESKYALTVQQKLEIYYWMQLTRTYDDTMVAYWRQGKGLGGVFSQRGHEAISVAAGYALEADDVAAPMHRDLGCYFVRGITPRRIFAQMMGRATGVSGGRDVNLHGAGDMNFNIVGFISHLPHSLPVAVGVAMSFTYRKEKRVALTFVGDGSSSEGLFHESLNLAAIHNAPFVLIVENNQYAYSTPLDQQIRDPDIANRAAAYGVPGLIVDGNDVEAVYAVTKEAVERARAGGGPTLIECKTMRMMGHAIHDGADYVPRELLEAWEKRNPVELYQRKLIEQGVADQAEIDEIKQRCEIEVADAIDFAEKSPFPDPATVLDGVYAP